MITSSFSTPKHGSCWPSFFWHFLLCINSISQIWNISISGIKAVAASKKQMCLLFCSLTRLFLLSLQRSLSFLSRLVLKVASCSSWATSLGWRRTRRYNSRFIILLISSPLPDCPLILALDHLMVVGKYELLCITFTIINPDTLSVTWLYEFATATNQRLWKEPIKQKIFDELQLFTMKVMCKRAILLLTST